MKVKTKGGVEYEVPEDVNLFAEARTPSDPFDGRALARVIQRLEYVLEEREVQLEVCHDRLQYAGREVIELDRRLRAAEAKIDELVEGVADAQASRG